MGYAHVYAVLTWIYAAGFGITAARVRAPDELTYAIVEALESDEPRLIHVPVGPMPDPWKFVHLGKVRG